MRMHVMQPDCATHARAVAARIVVVGVRKAERRYAKFFCTGFAHHHHHHHLFTALASFNEWMHG